MKKQHLRKTLPFTLAALLVGIMIWYYDVYVNWQPQLYPLAVAALTAGVLALTLLTLWARGEKRIAMLWKTVLSVIAFMAPLLGVSYLINNVIDATARQAATVALPLCAAQILVLLVLSLQLTGKLGRISKRALAGVILAALIGGIWASGLLARPLKLDTETPLPDDYALWETRTCEALTGDMSSIVSADSGTLAWRTSYAINAYCRAYQATGEEIYLEKAGGYLYEIFQLAADNDGDGYKNWGTSDYSDGGRYEEYFVHTGALLSSAGEWINLLYSTPDMLEKHEPTSGMRYQALCEYLIDEATQHLIPAFEPDWDEAHGMYIEWQDSGSGTTSLRLEKRSTANNRFLAMAAVLIQFAKLSPEHEELYLRRADAMLGAFHAKLGYDQNGNITTWNYRDVYLEEDEHGPGAEDFSHGRESVRAAIMGYANGLAFTEDNVRAFARVYASMLRGRQKEPLLAWRVDGKGEANNPVGLFIYDLSPFGGVLWRAGYRTALFRGAAAYSHDAARILAFHEHAPAPQAFTLLSASPGTERILFRWENSTHACKYTLQISDRADFSNLIINRANILDTSVFVEKLPESKTLYWRVIAANQGGGEYVSETMEVTV